MDLDSVNVMSCVRGRRGRGYGPSGVEIDG